MSASSVPPAERERSRRICVRADVPTASVPRSRLRPSRLASSTSRSSTETSAAPAGARTHPPECLTERSSALAADDCREQLHLALEHVGRSPAGSSSISGRRGGDSPPRSRRTRPGGARSDTVDANPRSATATTSVTTSRGPRCSTGSAFARSPPHQQPDQDQRRRELGVENRRAAPLAVRPGVHNREYPETKARRSATSSTRLASESGSRTMATTRVQGGLLRRRLSAGACARSAC